MLIAHRPLRDVQALQARVAAVEAVTVYGVCTHPSWTRGWTVMNADIPFRGIRFNVRAELQQAGIGAMLPTTTPLRLRTSRGGVRWLCHTTPLLLRVLRFRESWASVWFTQDCAETIKEVLRDELQNTARAGEDGEAVHVASFSHPSRNI